MTVVAATPPPRLPVRDRSAGSREGRVSPMLARPAAEEATGVLVRACGDLYPAEGRVVHAESPFAPGLDVLLTAHGTLGERVWRKAADRAHTGADCGRDAGHLLLDAGLLTPGALELCHLGALTTPRTSPSPRAARRAASTTAPPTGWVACTRCRSPPWSTRRCAGAPCCTASGRTRPPTPRPCGRPARRPPPRRSRPGRRRCRPGWTASAGRRTSPGSWAGRRSTRWWTYDG